MRRNRLSTCVTALLLAAVAGCSTDGGAGTAATGSPSAALPATSATSAGSPSPSAARVIASSALLQPEDLGGAKLEPIAAGESAHLRPVRPCDAKYPSDATRTAAVAMRTHTSPGNNETPRVLLQYVGLHPGHAPAAFAEIAAAIQRCPGSLATGQHTWTIAATGIVGDESLLVRVSERHSYGDAANVVTSTTPVVVTRVGDHVMIVADLGWETASGDEPYVRQLAAKGVERLRTSG